MERLASERASLRLQLENEQNRVQVCLFSISEIDFGAIALICLLLLLAQALEKSLRQAREQQQEADDFTPSNLNTGDLESGTLGLKLRSKGANNVVCYIMLWHCAWRVH